MSSGNCVAALVRSTRTTLAPVEQPTLKNAYNTLFLLGISNPMDSSLRGNVCGTAAFSGKVRRG
ncbi:hypothetical protein BVRB_4g084670 [Beta vulgaris subsp. vulgaris]|nr:hypothetical protein BVRB_4g084670 [Beta vulgaris subsp. vulgaris]